MDYQAQQEIQRDLDGSESLLWSGRPKQGVLLRRSDGYMIPFSLLWCGFAIFWEWSAATSGAPPFFLLFGGVFVLVGLHFVFGRFISDARLRRNTLYGITNERVIIRTGKKVKSLNLRTLSDISLNEGSTGEGTILLGPESPMGAWQGGFAWPGMPQGTPQLEQIADAKAVFDILRKAQRES